MKKKFNLYDINTHELIKTLKLPMPEEKLMKELAALDRKVVAVSHYFLGRWMSNNEEYSKFDNTFDTRFATLEGFLLTMNFILSEYRGPIRYETLVQNVMLESMIVFEDCKNALDFSYQWFAKESGRAFANYHEFADAIKNKLMVDNKHGCAYLMTDDIPKFPYLCYPYFVEAYHSEDGWKFFPHRFYVHDYPFTEDISVDGWRFEFDASFVKSIGLKDYINELNDYMSDLIIENLRDFGDVECFVKNLMRINYAWSWENVRTTGKCCPSVGLFKNMINEALHAMSEVTGMRYLSADENGETVC